MNLYKNPNEEELQEIVEAVEANGGYCPCALEKNEDTKCPCKNFRISKETDFCHCGRFYKIREYETLALIGDISDYSNQEEYLTWLERLDYQDFITYGIPLNKHDYHCGSEPHMQLSKTKIAKADAVLILIEENQALTNIIEELCEWAIRLNKKILYRSDLKQ